MRLSGRATARPLGRADCSGVRGNGKLLIQSHFLSFPLIPLVDDGDGVRGSPPSQGTTRASACAETTGEGLILGPICPVWPCLLLRSRLKMRPPWLRLAHRSLLRGGPAGPGCGLGWPRQEWRRVAGTFNSVAFGCISLDPYRLRRLGMRGSLGSQTAGVRLLCRERLTPTRRG